MSKHKHNHNQHRRHHHLSLSPSLRKQQGVVIVVALFIVALVAAMSYVMMNRLERDTRRSLLLQRDAQASYYAQGSIIWALDQLRNNAEHKRTNKLVDTLPIKSPVTTVNGYHISSVIYDMQDRFNVNNLVESQWHGGFIHFLQAVVPQLDEEKAGALLSSIYDWIQQNNSDTILNKYYFALPTPYRSAHRAMVTISELNLVKGMTPQIFEALKPYLVALPVGSKINVINATAPVLLTLNPSLNIGDAKKIREVLNATKITTVEAFKNIPPVKKADIPAEKITTKSDYFLVETEVTIENQRTLLYTLLKRNNADNRVSIQWQSKNVY